MSTSAPIELAQQAVEIASEHQASDIVMLNIASLTTLADYFVILSAESMRQLDALVDALAQGLKKQGARLYRREGVPESGWVLLDFSDVIVHVFAQEEREHYRLEQAWQRAVPLVKIQ